jgi:hypothetical protein
MTYIPFEIEEYFNGVGEFGKDLEEFFVYVYYTLKYIIAAMI